ncbi:MAG: DUF349 domain-containing protein [Flavobacteriaceae bacterium]|nr:DUF349 domain-containing protein [Flavobacteriaceae bacterium]
MMEKSTEPNESKQEEGINEASEIITGQEEKAPKTEPQTVPEVKPIKTQLNFDTLELDAYADILKKMIHADDWSKKGKEIQEVISQFDNRFGKIFTAKRKEHIDVEGNDLDFEFSPTYKKEVSQLIREYKTNKSAHYKSLEKSQKENLEKRLEIIEQIKALIGISENNSNNYKKFRALQESWHQTGQVPRADSNNVWETYKHHVERFYDFLHLDRALREKDFKHNYEEKLKLIERAETLVDHQDVVVAIRELNVLHRQWKTDLGPVAREHREELWNRFQDASAKIHERKNEYNKNIDAILLENLAKKKAILTTIEELYTDHASNHNAWQNSLKQVNTLKEKFHNIGRIPRAQNKAIWNEFRLTLKNFNHQKNEFYKTQKQEEKIHIEQKKVLITEVKSILESADWRSYTDRMKAIQVAWKKTGRISRKLSNQLWEEFKTATDLYFARLKNKEEAYSEQDQAILKAKRAYFEDFKSQEAPTGAQALTDYIENAFQNWNAMGEPSEGVKNSMQREYTDFLRGLWNKTDLKGEEKVAAQFKTDLLLLKDNEEGLNKEHILLKKKIDESKTELIQLENNLAFFSTTSSENPMVQDVNAKIKKLNNQIEHWGSKVTQIKTLSRELKKSLETDSTEDVNEETLD